LFYLGDKSDEGYINMGISSISEHNMMKIWDPKLVRITILITEFQFMHLSSFHYWRLVIFSGVGMHSYAAHTGKWEHTVIAITTSMKTL
jgi:hypothetical protein